MNKKSVKKYPVLLVIFSIILIVVAVILLSDNKKDNNNVTNSNNNSTTNQNESKYRNFECAIKRSEDDNYSSLEKYIFDVDDNDKLLNYTNQHIYTYKTKELYNSTKKISKEENTEFVDKELKIIKNYKKDKVTNSENIEVEILYTNFISSLEEKGFSCKENK